MNIPPEDILQTLGSTAGAEIRTKGSRFIALAAPAFDREAGGKIVRSEEKKYHAASHHCWAWRSLAEAGTEFGWEDDGEPAGTAGLPILKAIRGEGLAGVVVVVSRYFGGVKLGAGGLARAYAEAAGKALAAAPKKPGLLAVEFSLTFDYPLVGVVNQLVETSPAVITSRRFGEKAGLNIAVATSRAAAFISELGESTSARVEIVALGVRPVFPD